MRVTRTEIIWLFNLFISRQQSARLTAKCLATLTDLLGKTLLVCSTAERMHLGNCGELCDDDNDEVGQVMCHTFNPAGQWLSILSHN